MLNIREEAIEEIEEKDTDISKYFKTSEYCIAGEVKFSLADVKDDNGEYDGYMDVMVE
jgi:hypothetical protein